MFDSNLIMKQLLENLIKEWWSWPLPKILPRETSLDEFIDLPISKAIAVVGFRRVGKTYLLFDIAAKIGQENCVYLNFEDERLEKKTEILTCLSDVLTELKGQKSFVLLLDEIQNIPNWNLWVRRILESGKHRIFISGSSSKLTSSQLPTEMRGRSLTIPLSPLNFGEFLLFKNKDLLNLPEAEKLNLTREYLTYGGFPEVVLVEEGKKPLILDEYFQTFLLRDLIERHKIRNDLELKTLIKLLFNSSYYTISKLTNNLKGSFANISKSTASRYISFLEESFFLKNLTLHTASIKNRLKAPKKPYFVDSFFLSRFSTQFSQNMGRLIEQAVATKLFSEICSDLSSGIYYWKDNNGLEVDFVIRKNEVTEKLIQVSFVSETSQVSERETKALLKASDSLSCKDLTLITWSLETSLKIKDKQIKCLPLWMFLFESGPSGN